MRRHGACALFCTVAGLAAAQPLTPLPPRLGFLRLDAKARVEAAYTLARESPYLYLTLEGVQESGDKKTPFSTHLSWAEQTDDAGRRTPKLEMVEWQGGEQLTRVVGDGETLWSYDVRRNQYRAVKYAGQTDLGLLLRSLGRVARGQSVHAVRLLREIYERPEAAYQPWVAGAKEAPVLEELSLRIGEPVRRELRFRFDWDGRHERLSAMRFFDEEQIGGIPRRVEWEMRIFASNFIPAASNFIFVPPERGGGAPPHAP